jgi:hypothetical protein
VFTGDVGFSADNPGEVTDLPVGTECTLTEVDDNGATDVDISPNPVQLVAAAPVLVDVTITNTIPVGALTLEKVIDGGAASEVPDGVTFTLGVDCEFDGVDLIGFPQEVVLATPDDLSATLTGLPVGSVRTVSEPDDGGATSVAFDPPGAEDGISGEVTITDDLQDPVTVTVTNTFDPALLVILKEVQPTDALVPPDLEFTAQVDCLFQGESIYSNEVEFGVDSPGLISGLIVGSECTVTETESHGATPEPLTQTVVVEGPNDPVVVEVTFTNTFDTGALTVSKVVDDGGTGLVPSGTAYSVNAACTLDGAALPGFPQDAVLTTPDDLTETFTGLPFGTECQLSEPDPNGAASVTFDPADTVTIDETTPEVTVTVTNSYPVGSMTVAKVVDGPGAEFVPANATFTVEVTCTYPAGFPGGPGAMPGFNPLVIPLTSGQVATVGPLPVGSQCTTTEIENGGAESSAISPDQPVTIGAGTTPVAVTVTNLFCPPELQIRGGRGTSVMAQTLVDCPETDNSGATANTGANGLVPMMWASALLLGSGVVLTAVARRRRAD